MKEKYIMKHKYLAEDENVRYVYPVLRSVSDRSTTPVSYNEFIYNINTKTLVKTNEGIDSLLNNIEELESYNDKESVSGIHYENLYYGAKIKLKNVKEDYFFLDQILIDYRVLSFVARYKTKEEIETNISNKEDIYSNFEINTNGYFDSFNLYLIDSSLINFSSKLEEKIKLNKSKLDSDSFKQLLINFPEVRFNNDFECFVKVTQLKNAKIEYILVLENKEIKVSKDFVEEYQEDVIPFSLLNIT